MTRVGVWLALLVVAISPLAAGCSAPSDGPALSIADEAAASEQDAPRGRELSPAARAKCLAEGGFVQRAGLLGYEGCYRRFKDGGKSCSDGAQCLAGRCDYKGKGDEAASGLRGQCASNNIPFGCRQSLINGRITESICVD
jgi:hypothetical protein